MLTMWMYGDSLNVKIEETTLAEVMLKTDTVLKNHGNGNFELVENMGQDYSIDIAVIDGNLDEKGVVLLRDENFGVRDKVTKNQYYNLIGRML